MIGDPQGMLIGRQHAESAEGGAIARHAPAADLLHRCAHHYSTALLALGALSAGGLLVLALFGSARPAWWREAPFAAGAVQRRERATALDNGAWTVVTQVRPMSGSEATNNLAVSEPWSVSLTADDATAWLNEKLPRWLAMQHHPAHLPEGAELQVAFEPGIVRLGVRVPEGGGSEGSEGGRFVSLTLHPRIDADGLWLPATTASVGRLDVPLGLLVSSPPGELEALLLGRVPALRAAAIHLPDGRTVRLLRFESIDHKLVLTMQTEARR